MFGKLCILLVVPIKILYIPLNLKEITDLPSVLFIAYSFYIVECIHVKLYLFEMLLLLFDDRKIEMAKKNQKEIVGLPRDQNMANLNKLRQVAKFGMIVYYKIVINNLI